MLDFIAHWYPPASVGEGAPIYLMPSLCEALLIRVPSVIKTLFLSLICPDIGFRERKIGACSL